jgi:hypothetical protein
MDSTKPVDRTKGRKSESAWSGPLLITIIWIAVDSEADHCGYLSRMEERIFSYRDYLRSWNLLQPPNSVISLAFCKPYGSQMNPLTHRPSRTSIDPNPNGEGIASRNLPTTLIGMDHISISIQAPSSETLKSPGFAGVLSRSS